MSMALGIIGILALIVGLGWLIGNATKKKPFRTQGIIVAVGLVLFIVGIATTTPDVETSPATQTPASPSVEQPATVTQITSSEQDYLTTISEQSSNIGEALDNMSELMLNPLIGDNEWTLAVAVELAIIESICDEAIGMNSPSSMAHIHSKYVEAMKHYKLCVNHITQGIDSINENLIYQATVEMETATRLINEATELIEQFNETHSK